MSGRAPNWKPPKNGRWACTPKLRKSEHRGGKFRSSKGIVGKLKSPCKARQEFRRDWYYFFGGPVTGPHREGKWVKRRRLIRFMLREMYYRHCFSIAHGLGVAFPTICEDVRRRNRMCRRASK